MPLPAPFSASTPNEAQRNTQLALYLLRLVEQQRVPPTLETMIWLDTPGDLEAGGLMPVEQRDNRERALSALSAAFTAWVLTANPPEPGVAVADEPRRAGTFANFADASYAFALLGR